MVQQGSAGTLGGVQSESHFLQGKIAYHYSAHSELTHKPDNLPCPNSGMWQAHHQRWELKLLLNRRYPFLTFDLKIILKQEGFHNINMSNLKYRIYSVSSENDQFPASNLQEMAGIW